MIETRKALWGKKPIEDMGINEAQESVRWLESTWLDNGHPKKQVYPIVKARLAILEWHEAYFMAHGTEKGYTKPETPAELQNAYDKAVADYWAQEETDLYFGMADFEEDRTR